MTTGRFFKLCIWLCFLLTIFSGAEGNAETNCPDLEEVRYGPPDIVSTAGRIVITKEPLPLAGLPPAGRRKVSPQGTATAVFFREPDFAKPGPWNTELRISGNRVRPLGLALAIRDQGNREVEAEWLNEKLLFLRVWWGRVISTDMVLNAEEGRFLYLEEADYRILTLPCEEKGRLREGEGFSDPFRYCRAFPDIDSPDRRYTGEAPPAAVLRGLRKGLAMPVDVPAEIVARGTFWRCMEGKVMACYVGANLPCTTRADLSRTPSAGITQFCRENPQAELVPMAVTGRATVYEWRCRSGAPQVVRQAAKTDSRGFLAHIWYEVPPDKP